MRTAARFVESFEVDDDLWLVFRDEGQSLQQLVYESDTAADDPNSDSRTFASTYDGAPSSDRVQRASMSAVVPPSMAHSQSSSGTRGSGNQPTSNSAYTTRTPVFNQGFARLVPSRHWRELKQAPGMPAMKSIMRQLLTGLVLIHSLRTVHRDIKPGNILLRKDRAHFGTVAEISVPDCDRQSFTYIPVVACRLVSGCQNL